MNNILNTSNGVATLISRTNDGTNVLTINSTTLDESDWVGSGNYTFTDSGQTFTIKRISENAGNVILKIIDDYNYELAKISEQAEDLAELAEQVAALQNTKQNNLIAGDNIELVDNLDNTTTISSSGGEIVYGPTIYSDEEREVGVWRDGKPLYQKTVNTGTLPNNTYKNIQHNINNVDNVVKIEGYAHRTSDNQFRPMPNHNGSSVLDNGIFIHVDITKVQIVTFYDLSDFTESYVTVQYTKTTDAAGSGDWTTDGIPAVHYSTDEHIIGTWIDGSTLYEKTIVYSCANSSSHQTVLSFTDKKIVCVKDVYFENINGDQVRYVWAGVHFWSFVVTTNNIQVKKDITSDANWQSGVTFIATIQYTKTS